MRRNLPIGAEMQNDMTIRIESLREAEAIRLQRLLALKRIGATVDYDEGRKLSQLIDEAKSAVRSLDHRIEMQHPAG